MLSSSIAIIGTGLAGLATARLLTDAGRKVMLFDKSRGSGGRMASKRSAFGDLDLGAQYFTARDPAFRQTVTDWQARGWVARWQPRLSLEPSHGGAEAERWVGSPRMSALTRNLLDTLPVQFNCRIDHILGQPGQWSLLDTDGNRHGPFTQVVVAIPAPQANALLAGVAADLAAQAASVPIDATWAVALGFVEPLPTQLQACFVRGPVLDWMACNSSKPWRDATLHSWVLHAASDWSNAHQELPAEEVIRQLHEAFQTVIGHPLPDPVFSTAHRWLYARANGERDWGALGDAENGLLVCGDWCLSGRIEGAWLSGREAARRILEAS